MPSYEQITLIGGPCDGEQLMWDGGDYFVYRQIDTPEPFNYIRSRDDQGKRTSRFVYQEQN